MSVKQLMLAKRHFQLRANRKVSNNDVTNSSAVSCF